MQGIGIMKANDLNTYVSTHTKSGETTSGRAIHDVTPDHDLYKAFTPSDHLDAAVHFKSKASDMMKAARPLRNEDQAKFEASADVFNRWADGHMAKAHPVKQAAVPVAKAAGGEGSKGGKIIGHTRSGKPVYEDSASKKFDSFKGWSKEDHADAGNLHYGKVKELLTKRNEERKKGNNEKAEEYQSKAWVHNEYSGRHANISAKRKS